MDWQLRHQLNRIERMLWLILRAEGIEMAAMDSMAAAVANLESTVATSTDVESSASSLLDQLSQIIRDNASDPAALTALADRLSSATAAEQSSNQALAAAVSANTPAAPATP